MNDIHCSVVKSPWTCPWLTHPVDFSSFGFPPESLLMAMVRLTTSAGGTWRRCQMDLGNWEMKNPSTLPILAALQKESKRPSMFSPKVWPMAFLLRWQKAKTRFFWGRISGFPHDFPTSLRKIQSFPRRGLRMQGTPWELGHPCTLWKSTWDSSIQTSSNIQSIEHHLPNPFFRAPSWFLVRWHVKRRAQLTFVSHGNCAWGTANLWLYRKLSARCFLRPCDVAYLMVAVVFII